MTVAPADTGEQHTLLTTKQVADMLHVDTRTVQRLIHDRQIDSIRVGRQFRIPPRAVQDYLHRNTVRAEANTRRAS